MNIFKETWFERTVERQKLNLATSQYSHLSHLVPLKGEPSNALWKISSIQLFYHSRRRFPGHDTNFPDFSFEEGHRAECSRWGVNNQLFPKWIPRVCILVVNKERKGKVSGDRDVVAWKGDAIGKSGRDDIVWSRCEIPLSGDWQARKANLLENLLTFFCQPVGVRFCALYLQEFLTFLTLSTKPLIWTLLYVDLWNMWSTSKLSGFF